MFAHQVIEDLMNSNFDYEKGIFKDAHDYHDSINRTIDIISNFAIKFHIGNLDPGFRSSIFDCDPLRPLFSDDIDAYKLPFPICYFDWIHTTGGSNVHKSAATVCTAEYDGSGKVCTHIQPINYFKLLNGKEGWELSSNSYVFFNGILTVMSSLPAFKNNIDQFPLTVIDKVLRILNCKNIGTETVPAPLKLNNKRKKAGKQPIFSYKTLVIKPVGKKQESIPKHLWNNRIHLARGHFKTYTKEKPLFGRITGRFWWQPSVRGRNRDGVVMKDYEVKTA